MCVSSRARMCVYFCACGVCVHANLEAVEAVEAVRTRVTVEAVRTRVTVEAVRTRLTVEAVEAVEAVRTRLTVEAVEAVDAVVEPSAPSCAGHSAPATLTSIKTSSPAYSLTDTK